MDNDATDQELGDGYKAYLAWREEQRATRKPVGLAERTNEVAPLRLGQEGVQAFGTPAHHPGELA